MNYRMKLKKIIGGNIFGRSDVDAKHSWDIFHLSVLFVISSNLKHNTRWRQISQQICLTWSSKSFFSNAILYRE